MNGKIVISGGGISGLLSALLIQNKGLGFDIYVLEKNSEMGGLHRRFNYGDWGDFDYGMHNILETNVPELDELIYSLLPENEWQILEGKHRDLAGIFFNGVLQKNTPYIDLRSLSREDYESCMPALFEHFNRQSSYTRDINSNAEQFAISRFGEIVARKTIIPSIEKIHKRKASELDYMATIFTPMERIAFCDSPFVAEVTSSVFLRDRIAWSDQRTLPAELTSGCNSIYPSRYGIYRVIDAIVNRLAASGVNLLTGAEVKDVHTDGDCISAVGIRTQNKNLLLDNVKHLIWTANIPLLGRFLEVDPGGLSYDKPLRTIIVNLVVDRLPEHMEDLYYFFCYDPAFNTYRLTNYTNYCNGAERNGGYPVSMELLMEEEAIQNTDLERLAIDEYHRLKVGNPQTKILFSKAEILDSGFPMPSLNNVHAMRTIREGIKNKCMDNLSLMGILSEDNLFFQRDVIADAYRQVNLLYESI